MKALIFGITGQDGSYLAESLLKKGYRVTGVTRRVSVNTSARIQHILPKIKIVEGDITDAFNVNKIIQDEEPDEIYNLAAQSHVGTSFNQPNLTWDITAGGVLNVLEAIRYSPNREHMRFYQASSSEMFGKNYTLATSGTLSVDTGGSVVVDSKFGKGLYTYPKYQDEDTSFVPQSPYGIAKLAAHHLVRIYRESYGIHGSCGILFNHESERRGEAFVTRKITKWISGFVDWLDRSELDKTQITKTKDSDELIYASGHQESYMKLRLGNLEAKRDWGHAEDYVEAMATGETHSVADFLDAAFAAVDIDDWSSLVFIDPKFYRPAEVDYLLGIPTKAEEKLGWKRKISFNDLAKRMVDCDVDLSKRECNEKRL